MINKSIIHACHQNGFNDKELQGAYKIFFGTLTSESRLKIINVLRDGKKNVSQLMESLNVEQSNLSHDLSRLKQCGFVNCEVDGKYRYYYLNQQTIKPLMDLIEKHMAQYCIHILRTSQEKKE